MRPTSLVTLRDGTQATTFEYPKIFARSQIDQALKHIRLSKARGLPQIGWSQSKWGKCIIVGAAPSMPRYLEDIRAYQKAGHAIFAVNETHDWLIDRGVIPYGAVVFEVSKELLHLFKRPHQNTTYYISSMCHPMQFRALRDCDMVVWHPFSDVEEHRRAMAEYPAPFMIGGGSTTYLRTIAVALQMGWHDFELYGVDSSFEGDSHVSGMSGDNGPVVETVMRWNDNTEEKRFKTFLYLLRQADEFRDYCEQNHHQFRMRVHGDGLMPFMHKLKWPRNYEGT